MVCGPDGNGTIQIIGMVLGTQGNTETQVVVPVGWRVPVAVGGPAVPAVVVPAAAAIHAVRARGVFQPESLASARPR